MGLFYGSGAEYEKFSRKFSRNFWELVCGSFSGRPQSMENFLEIWDKYFLEKQSIENFPKNFPEKFSKNFLRLKIFQKFSRKFSRNFDSKNWQRFKLKTTYYQNRKTNTYMYTYMYTIINTYNVYINRLKVSRSFQLRSNKRRRAID